MRPGALLRLAKKRLTIVTTFTLLGVLGAVASTWAAPRPKLAPIVKVIGQRQVCKDVGNTFTVIVLDRPTSLD